VVFHVPRRTSALLDVTSDAKQATILDFLNLASYSHLMQKQLQGSLEAVE